jgi:hypothetical protein
LFKEVSLLREKKLPQGRLLEELGRGSVKRKSYFHDSWWAAAHEVFQGDYEQFEGSAKTPSAGSGGSKLWLEKSLWIVWKGQGGISQHRGYHPKSYQDKDDF